MFSYAHAYIIHQSSIFPSVAPHEWKVSKLIQLVQCLLCSLRMLHRLLKCPTHGVIETLDNLWIYLWILLISITQSFFLVIVINFSLSSSPLLLPPLFLVDFPIDLEQSMSQTISPLGISWNYLSDEYSCIKFWFRMKELCPFFFSYVICPLDDRHAWGVFFDLVLLCTERSSFSILFFVALGPSVHLVVK